MEKRGWFNTLLNYASICKGKIITSVIFSIISVMAGIVPYLCVFKIFQAFIINNINSNTILVYSCIAAAAYLVKTVCFGISTSLSHLAAYTILEKLRLKVTDKFLRAPIGEVQRKSIGEIKNMLVDKIESIEPPLAHVIPEATGNIILPITAIIVLCILDWRIALA